LTAKVVDCPVEDLPVYNVKVPDARAARLPSSRTTGETGALTPSRLVAVAEEKSKSEAAMATRNFMVGEEALEMWMAITLFISPCSVIEDRNQDENQSCGRNKKDMDSH
jgi:hypothetical protein